MGNNSIKVLGTATTNLEFDHESFGENFYRFSIAIKRDSGCVDKVPVIVSERNFDVSQEIIHRQFYVEGEFRSFNMKECGRSHLLLYIFAIEMYETEDENDVNEVLIDGYICKEPILRDTPLGRKIADVLVASNRQYGKSDYIPCICWGRNATYSSKFKVGQHISLVGRVQSREYQKKTDDGIKLKTAYEISIGKIFAIE